MNRNIIYTIILTFILVTLYTSYKLITAEIEKTKPTHVNTKAQPCPDYWIFDASTQKCYKPGDSENGVDFSDYTFCEKKEYSKNNSNPSNPIPWNGISNIDNPRCDNMVLPQTATTGDSIETTYEYGYIHNVLSYSLFFMVILSLEYVLGTGGMFIKLFVGIIVLEVLLFYIFGIDSQSIFLGNRYTKNPNPEDDSRLRCYNWSCFFS